MIHNRPSLRGMIQKTFILSVNSLGSIAGIHLRNNYIPYVPVAGIPAWLLGAYPCERNRESGMLQQLRDVRPLQTSSANRLPLTRRLMKAGYQRSFG